MWVGMQTRGTRGQSETWTIALLRNRGLKDFPGISNQYAYISTSVLYFVQSYLYSMINTRRYVLDMQYVISRTGKYLYARRMIAFTKYSVLVHVDSIPEVKHVTCDVIEDCDVGYASSSYGIHLVLDRTSSMTCPPSHTRHAPPKSNAHLAIFLFFSFSSLLSAVQTDAR